MCGERGGGGQTDPAGGWGCGLCVEREREGARLTRQVGVGCGPCAEREREGARLTQQVGVGVAWFVCLCTACQGLCSLFVSHKLILILCPR